MTQRAIKDHLILRCRGKETINLTRRLAGASLSAWTPTHRRRMNINRCRRTRMIEVPTMASYVFLGAGDLVRAMKVRECYRCPPFGVMRRHEARVSIWDRELNHLRRLSAEMGEKQTELLAVGTQALVSSGPMAEYLVEVIGQAGAFNIVTGLDRKWRMKMPPVMLKSA